jgi:Rieske Fe-S protein
MEEFDRKVATFLAMFSNAQPGVVRKVTPKDLSDPKNKAEVDEAKRNMLKLMAVGGLAALAGGGAVAGALQYLEPPMVGLPTYPRVQLLYDDGTPVVSTSYRYTYEELGQIIFDYPLTNEPNMLLNLKYPAPNGIGPNGTLVAFSAICQHLGCIPPYISYYPPGDCPTWNNNMGFIHCTCHGSTYNPYVSATANGGGAAIITGPTVLPIPQVILEEDSNHYVYAVRMIGPPVKGHFNTLVGGQGVSSSVKTSPPETPVQSCPT